MSASMKAGQPLEEAQPSALSCAEVDYWLCRCQGFTVSDPDGRVGTVGYLRFGSALHRPDALAVRIGLVRRHFAVVATDSVDCIDPTNRQLTVSSRVASRWRADRASDVKDSPPEGEAPE